MVLLSERNELGVNVGHEAWIKGVLFDQLLENLLGDLVIFKMVVNLKVKCRLGLGAGSREPLYLSLSFWWGFGRGWW